MYVSPISSTIYPNRSSFKGVEVASHQEWGDSVNTQGPDGGGGIVHHSSDSAIIKHEYYKLADEPEETATSFMKKYPAGINKVYEDRTQGFDIYEEHLAVCLGILPIKVAEWAAYTTNKASMKIKDVMFIEEVLNRMNLKQLLR